VARISIDGTKTIDTNRNIGDIFRDINEEMDQVRPNDVSINDLEQEVDRILENGSTSRPKVGGTGKGKREKMETEHDSIYEALNKSVDKADYQIVLNSVSSSKQVLY